MITSFSRLFRQIFGGSRAQPATEAPTRDSVADVEVREAAEHRENLKRAMETAFATPTATVEDPQAPPVVALQAAAEQAVAAMTVTVQEQEDVQRADDQVEEARVVEDVPAADVRLSADPAEAVVEMQGTEPVAAEATPAIDLSEVEESTEHDVEVVDWDMAKLTREPGGAGSPDQSTIAVPAGIPAEGVAEPTAIVAEDQVEPVETGTPDLAVESEPAVSEECAAMAVKPKRTRKTKAPAKKKTSSATKKKSAAKKKVDLPQDAVWLSDAIAFSLKGEWSSVWTPPDDSSGAERLESFREKAAAGDIIVWGRPEGSEAWEPLKAAYWKTAFVDPLSFLMGRENVVTDPKASKAKKPVKYAALKVAKADVETLWPPAVSETVRDAA